MTTGGSIFSFPDRGPCIDTGYSGLSSGYVYREIFEVLQPCVFTDPMVGGGTSVEVAREIGIEAHGLNLHSGFNILKQRILEAVGKPSDLVLSHPPYHNIVVYSGKVWGRVGHPDDLSRCATEDEFLEKLTIALKNQRHATKGRGLLRSNHRGQHNVASNGREYPLKLPRIMHECGRSGARPLWWRRGEFLASSRSGPRL